MITVRFAALVLGALLALAAVAPSGADAQTLRPPELNRQYYRAQAAWKSGTSMLEAKARIDQVLKELPNDAEARKLRAEVLLAMDRPAAALIDAERAVALRPNDPEAHLLHCEAASQMGQIEAAGQALDRAAALALEDATLHVRLSWNAVNLRQFDKAEAFARTALALDPNAPASYYQLARVFVLRDQINDAALTLVRGFQSSLLDPVVIEQDATLARTLDHPALAPYLRQ